MPSAVAVAYSCGLVACSCALVAGCHADAVPHNAKPPDAGISLALYASADDSFAVVDDRRWVEVTGRSLWLANIDPGAELASLVFEPADPGLHLGACTREPLPAPARPDPAARQGPEAASIERPAAGARFAPVVACEVRGKPGRHLVRIVYVTKSIGFGARHDIDVREQNRADVTSRFAIRTPAWQARGEVVLYDGVPGGESPPRELARGPIALDGSTAVLATSVREVRSQLRRVYEGAVVTTPDSTDVTWGHDSVQAIWVWLELAGLRLAPGPVHVHLDLAGEGVRDFDVAQASWRGDDGAGAPLRLPLWVDESLRGTRVRVVEYNDGASLAERYMFSIANTGDTAREVWIEEPLRKATRRRLARAWPTKPTAANDVLRGRLVVRPGGLARAGFTMTYEF